MASERPIYMDGHATTPASPEVLESMLPYFRESFANPSSVSEGGSAASRAVLEARRAVALLVDASERDVVFTSGATESINLAIQGFCVTRGESKTRIALTHLEHRAVLSTVKALHGRGQVEIRWLEVDDRGRLLLEDVRQACAEGLELICLMKANNEVGTVYPVETVASLAREYGVAVFSDVTQAVGWISPEAGLYGADALALSAHKIHGPKGVGALIISGGFPVRPVLFGGAPDRGVRPGTKNVPGIVGLGTAAREAAKTRREAAERIAMLRDQFERVLKDGWPGVLVNGALDSRLPNNCHVAFPGIPNDLLLARASGDVVFSLGSACSSAEEGPSHVLRGMGLSSEVIESSVRFGLTRELQAEQVDTAAEVLVQHVRTIAETLGVSKETARAH